MLKQLDETKLDSISYNAKKEKLLLDKSPNNPAKVPKLIKPPEVPKQVHEVKFDAISFNVCKERTCKGFKLMDKVELDAIGCNACKKRTGAQCCRLQCHIAGGAE